ncbi:MAG: WbqC family protein [Patescibacteria group bacterium]
MITKTIAIHQPNLFPWYGYFMKIAQSDQFIFFDHVSISNSKDWVSRVKILLNGKPFWISMPIHTSGGVKHIFEVPLATGNAWRKILGTIKLAYYRHPHFREIYEFLNTFASKDSDKISNLNIDFITTLTSKLGFDKVSFDRTSSYDEINKSAKTQTGLIVQVCEYFKASHYLSGTGCLGFLDDTEFARKHLILEFQNLEGFAYPQKGLKDFVPGLSIIDILMNCGFNNTRNRLLP